MVDSLQFTVYSLQMITVHALMTAYRSIHL